jgi:hypothetical protein
MHSSDEEDDDPFDDEDDGDDSTSNTSKKRVREETTPNVRAKKEAIEGDYHHWIYTGGSQAKTPKCGKQSTVNQQIVGN